MLAICAFLFLVLRIGGTSIESEFHLNGNDATAQMFVNAAIEILKSFYMKVTTTVFITISSETNEIKELLGETIKSEILLLTYVIEESEYVNDQSHRRYFNLFIVDTYESFQ